MRFLDMACGSSYELETQLILAKDLDYILDNELVPMTDKIVEIQKMIYGLKRSLESTTE